MIKINGEIIPIKYFNDGTLRLKYLVDNQCPRDEILWLYDNEEEVVHLWHFVKHIKECKPDGIIDLCIPYLPEARMDRRVHSEEVFTLKFFADLLNSLPLHSVKVFDVHSHVAEALLNRIIVESPAADLRMLTFLHPDASFFFPDEGSMKRYSGMLADNNYTFGAKQRNWDSQQVEYLYIFGDKNLIVDKNIIICDDIISRGTTLFYASRQLKAAGARDIYVWASHVEDTIFKPNINGKSLLDYGLITKIYTTNSIYRGNHPQIEVIHEF